MVYIGKKEDNTGLDSLNYLLEEKRKTLLYTKFIIKYEDYSELSPENEEAINKIKEYNNILLKNRSGFSRVFYLYLIFNFLLILRFLSMKYYIKIRYKFKGKISNIIRHLPMILKWLSIADLIYIFYIVINGLYSLLESLILK